MSIVAYKNANNIPLMQKLASPLCDKNKQKKTFENLFWVKTFLGLKTSFGSKISLELKTFLGLKTFFIESFMEVKNIFV